MKPDCLLLQLWRAPARLASLTLPEWDVLLAQADSANLTSSLYYLVNEHVARQAMPPAVWRRLNGARVLAERHQAAARREVGRIAIALRDTGVPLILLKGAAYTMAQLPSGQGRLYTDIDILVPKARIGAVEAALMTHGWVASGFDAYDQRYYREWMHEIPPMTHMRRTTTIDVHHAILPLTARVRPDSALLLAAAVPVPGEPALYYLAPADLVLHSATHLFFDGESDHGTRDMVDLDRLLRHFGRDPAFWAALPARAAALQLARPLFYALRHAIRLFATPVPAPVLAEVDRLARPGPLALALTDAMFARTLMPSHASCQDGWSALARLGLYLRGNWLRMPPLMLARHLFHKAFISPKGDAAKV